MMSTLYILKTYEPPVNGFKLADLTQTAKGKKTVAVGLLDNKNEIIKQWPDKTGKSSLLKIDPPALWKGHLLPYVKPRTNTIEVIDLNSHESFDVSFDKYTRISALILSPCGENILVLTMSDSYDLFILDCNNQSVIEVEMEDYIWDYDLTSVQWLKEGICIKGAVKRFDYLFDFDYSNCKLKNSRPFLPLKAESLPAAIFLGNEDIVHQILDDKQIKWERETLRNAFDAAADCGDSEIIKKLLSKFPKKYRSLLLAITIKNDLYNLIPELVSLGIPMNADFLWSSISDIMSGEMVKTLVNAGMDPNMDHPNYPGCTSPLLLLQSRGGSDFSFSAVLEMINAGADVNFTAKEGEWNVLKGAAYMITKSDSSLEEAFQIYKLLISKGVDLNAVHSPKSNGNFIRYFPDNCALPAIAQVLQQTEKEPFLAKDRGPCLDLLDFLVQNGADINLKCGAGYPMYFYSTRKEHLDWFKAKGVDVYQKGPDNITLAEGTTHVDIKEWYEVN